MLKRLLNELKIETPYILINVDNRSAIDWANGSGHLKRTTFLLLKKWNYFKLARLFKIAGYFVSKNFLQNK